MKSNKYQYLTRDELAKLEGQMIMFLGWNNEPADDMLTFSRGEYWLGNYKATTVRVSVTSLTKVEEGKLCFVWYPMNSFTTRLDLFYCLPLCIDQDAEYSTCFLFYGELNHLVPRGTYDDICTSDLNAIPQAVSRYNEHEIKRIEEQYAHLLNKYQQNNHGK